MTFLVAMVTRQLYVTSYGVARSCVHMTQAVKTLCHIALVPEA